MTNDDDFVQMAEQQLEQGQPQLAVKCLASALARNPRNYRAHTIIAEIYYRRSRFEDAIAHFRLAAAHDPNPGAYAHRIAECAHMIGQQMGDSAQPTSHTPELVAIPVELRRPTPDRISPYDYPVFGLGTASPPVGPEFWNSVDELGARSIDIYVRGPNAIDIIDRMQESDQCSRIERIIVDRNGVGAGGPTNYDLAKGVLSLSADALVVYDEPGIEAPTLVRRLCTETGFFGQAECMRPDMNLILANAELSPCRLSDIVNCNATVLVTVPRCGSGLFRDPFLQIAGLAGRAVPVGNLNLAPGRPREVVRILDDGPDRANRVRSEIGSSHYLANLFYACINLNFFEVAEIHEAFPTTYLADLEYLDILMLMRDPRDVIVSAAFSQLHQGGKQNGSEAIEEQLADRIEQYLPAVIETFLSGWRGSNCYPVKYESLIEDFPLEIRRVLTWLDWKTDISGTMIENAVKLTDPLEMRAQRTADHGDGEGVAQVRGRMFRKGRVGDWKNYLTADLKDRFKEIAGDALVELEYEVNDEW